MTAKIMPQEFHFAENRNNIDVRTTVAKEEIDDAGKIFIQPIRSIGGISAGDDILVKIMSDDGGVQLHRRMFTVTKAADVRKVVMDARGLESIATLMEYTLEPLGDWWASSFVEGKPVPQPGSSSLPREPEIYVSGEGEIKWNPGKKAYEVMVNGEAVAEIARLHDESKDDYKARAIAIAAGSDPLPKVA